MEISRLNEIDEQVEREFLEVWQEAVEATHTFLDASEIKEIRVDVKAGIHGIEQLYSLRDNDEIIAFMGIEDNKLEMLFVSPKKHGQGLGKLLVEYGCRELKVELLDVNEQNKQAVGFYQHMGFTQIGYSPLDGEGRAYPILHLALEKNL